MKIEHLSEVEIQLFVLDNSSCGVKIREHVQVCQYCRMKTQNYELLFTTIKAQPQASFDFNLVASVIEKLPEPKYSFNNILVFFIAGLTILSMGLVFSFYGNPLLVMLSQMAPLVAYLVFCTAISILGFLCMDNYIKFLKQIKKLNYN